MKKQWMVIGLALSAFCPLNSKANDRLSEIEFAASEQAITEPVRLVGYEQEIPNIELCCEPERCATWAVGAELPLLTLYANHGSGGNASPLFGDFDTNAALRLTAAYKSPGILGFRGRFFNFETTGNQRPDDFFDVRSFDLETTTDLSIKDWNFTAFGGIRWTDIDYVGGRFANIGTSFEGMGATFGVDVQRVIGNGFSLIGGIRQSYLLGDTTSQSSIENVVVPITEFRLGGEYGRELGCGVRAVAGVGYELQEYSSLSFFAAGRIDPEDVDVALGGPVFSLTFER